ncbi:MAG: rod shape-determining protein MreC [Candidatus Omnitrophica bacterium]|nr:rod shape-determining protein MreC [Candidatus Omnitrophota bacterium]
MLWIFRKELIFLFFLFFSFLISKASLNKKTFTPVKIKEQNFFNYEEIIQENKRLREILNLKEKKTFSSFEVAEVIGMKPYVYPAELFINKGREEGITENMVIFTKDFFLIGKVEKVERSYSKVMTLFNHNTKISVILNSTREIGIIEGGYGPFLILKYIPYDSKVRINDEVYTSGFSEYYHSGIKIGKVVKIYKNPSSLYLKIWVKPYITSYGFEEVIIGK